MRQLICIVGSTATGKTNKAIEMARDNRGIIISADSRQVYRGMDIVPGKDHPKNIKIYGIDLVGPADSCSVSLWYDAVVPYIQNVSTDTPIILVGGTGLYVNAITHGIATMSVPINHKLRRELSYLDTSQLQAKLISHDKPKFDSMNHSDALNPRRLMRAIEVAISKDSPLKSAIPKMDIKMIGLKYKEINHQKEQIKKRVIARLVAGAVEETRDLLSKYDSSLQSFSAIGYRSIKEYLDGKLSKNELIEKWVTDEMQYVKRQMTWFRKQSVIWYDVDNQ